MYNSLLRDREVQYIALRDETSKTWRILDTWHEALKELDLEDDIPDDNPAVSILTESAFTALIKEAARLGVLENIDFGSDNSYELEEKDADNRLQIFQERKAVIQQKLFTAERLAKELKSLVDVGGYQKMQFLRQLDEVFELKSQISNTNLEMSRSQLESSKSLDRLKNELKQVELQLKYQNVVAPVSGVIFESQASPEGVLAAGETILTIVPQEGLKGQVFVSNTDIGFVKPGLKAKIRVDAFPFTRYGELVGNVSQIGADALPPDDVNPLYRFPVKLDLDKDYLESRGNITKLRSGLAITANLKLREKRVISLLSDLLVDQTESIKTIRQQ